MIGRVKCWLGFHVGRPEMLGDHMAFYCTRCQQHTGIMSVEQTEAVLREMYEDTSVDYNEFRGG